MCHHYILNCLETFYNGSKSVVITILVNNHPDPKSDIVRRAEAWEEAYIKLVKQWQIDNPNITISFQAEVSNLNQDIVFGFLIDFWKNHFSSLLLALILESELFENIFLVNKVFLFVKYSITNLIDIYFILFDQIIIWINKLDQIHNIIKYKKIGNANMIE